ncbi:MAG: hypothetical protein IKO80_10780 [Lachnospiraceae bacterium]|nr:hypothetical protein [Lachnospiraceae bacterium]
MNGALQAKDEKSRIAVANENAAAAYTGKGTADQDALLTVQGYKFLIEEDAEAARTDLVRIEHLNKYLKNTKGDQVQPLYEKSIQNRLFSTPVGWEYLQDLREMLIDQGVDADRIPPIPIGVPVTRRRLPGDYRTRERIEESAPEPMGMSLKTSLIINIVLGILVILMFVIANTSKTDNILNYRRNVTNEYSTWAEDLTKREREVRRKERELGIMSTGLPVIVEDGNESGAGSAAGEEEDGQ